MMWYEFPKALIAINYAYNKVMRKWGLVFTIPAIISDISAKSACRQINLQDIQKLINFHLMSFFQMFSFTLWGLCKQTSSSGWAQHTSHTLPLVWPAACEQWRNNTFYSYELCENNNNPPVMTKITINIHLFISLCSKEVIDKRSRFAFYIRKNNSSTIQYANKGQKKIVNLIFNIIRNLYKSKHRPDKEM